MVCLVSGGVNNLHPFVVGALECKRVWRHRFTSGRADLAGGMTTWWRPDLERIRAEIAAEAELELEVKVEASDGDGAKQGTKRKRAPRTKGPCEHGVKYRSRCAALVRTDVDALSARSAVVHQSASTVVGAPYARSAAGHKYASTVASALGARSAVGAPSASTAVCALGARSARSSERIINQTNIASRRVYIVINTNTHTYDR